MLLVRKSVINILFEGSNCYNHILDADFLPQTILLHLLLRDSFRSLTNFMQINTLVLVCSVIKMYIDSQHILLVVTELDFLCFLYIYIYIWILFALHCWLWMFQRCMFLLFFIILNVFSFKKKHLTSFAFCLTPISVSVHLFMIHKPSQEVSEVRLSICFPPLFNYSENTDNHLVL